MNVIKRFALLLALLFIFTALSACQKDMDEAVATVDGRDIPRWYYLLYLNQQMELYKQILGKDMNSADYASELPQFKANVLEELIGQYAALNKAYAAGCGDLTPEELSGLETKYQADYKANVDALMAEYGTDENARRKAEIAYDERLQSLNLTPERFMESMKNELILSKYYNLVAEKTEITDEDVKKNYEEQVQKQIDACTADITSFGAETPFPILYYPEGYVKIRALEIGFITSDTGKLNDAYINYETANNNYVNAVLTKGVDSTAAKNAEKTLEKMRNTYTSVLTVTREKLNKKYTEVFTALSSGMSFDELKAKYFPDTEVKEYYVCEGATHMDSDAVAAAMTLTEPGQTAGPVETATGFMILQLIEKVESRTVELNDELRESIRENLFASQAASQGVYILEQCKTEAVEIIRYTDRL